MQKSKMAVWGGLTNSCEKKRSKKQRRKGRYKHLNADFQRIAKRDKKAFLSNQCKEIEENNRMGKTRDLFKKIGDTKGIFSCLTVCDTTDYSLPGSSIHGIFQGRVLEWVAISSSKA